MKKIADSKVLHGPVRDGKCTPCHDPHGGEGAKLLKGRYPMDLYATFDEGMYGFCLKCHQKNLLKFAETSIYTKFRNGKENLHYFHVAGRRSGRTCRACHEPHGSQLPHLMLGEGVSFGTWHIPVGFEQTATGGSCSPGCHQTFRYDRNNPESYRGKNPGPASGTDKPSARPQSPGMISNGTRGATMR